MPPEAIKIRLEGSHSAVKAAYEVISRALVSADPAGTLKNRGGGLFQSYFAGVVDPDAAAADAGTVIDVEVVAEDDGRPAPRRVAGARRAIEGGRK